MAVLAIRAVGRADSRLLLPRRVSVTERHAGYDAVHVVDFGHFIVRVLSFGGDRTDLCRRRRFSPIRRRSGIAAVVVCIGAAEVRVVAAAAAVGIAGNVIEVVQATLSVVRIFFVMYFIERTAICNR